MDIFTCCILGWYLSRNLDQTLILTALNFSMALSNLVTPYLAGLLIDTYDPNWIWYACGIVGTVTVFGYLYLHFRFESRSAQAASRVQNIP